VRTAAVARTLTSVTLRGDDTSLINNGDRERRKPLWFRPRCRRQCLKKQNLMFSLLKRELIGSSSSNSIPHSERLKAIGGKTLLAKLDKDSAGLMSEVSKLESYISKHDWNRVQSIISNQLAPRLVTDAHFYGGPTAATKEKWENAREAFMLSGGVTILTELVRNPQFVGPKVAETNDARDFALPHVTQNYGSMFNEIFFTLREIIYSFPQMYDPIMVNQFLPFLFTMLSHGNCFDGVAILIEEILTIQTQRMGQDQYFTENSDYFHLGLVPDLYRLWQSFSLRQLAHFCRILALLIFEPDDRQLMESSNVLKSVELLQARRDRASRVGLNPAVDCNQAVCLGDETLLKRLVLLVRVMNYAPSINRGTAYHVISQCPWIPDTLVMLGLSELDNFDDIERLALLANSVQKTQHVNLSRRFSQCSLGSVVDMLESLAAPLVRSPSANVTNIGNIVHVINAARQEGVAMNRIRDGNRSRPSVIEGYGTSSNVEESDNMQPLDPSIEFPEANALANQLLLERLPISFGINPIPRYQIHVVSSPRDAANELQFNAFLLSPYQVEIMFVLCTLLGGRRKLDAQVILGNAGLLGALTDMFDRLSWDSTNERGNDAENSHGGMHGPGCECNPDSALRVQYLRLIHNFCERDFDNYDGRIMMLSPAEKEYFSNSDLSAMLTDYRMNENIQRPGPRDFGLVSMIVSAFMAEEEDSPYKFWLASCAESYLRGSSAKEQLFVAHSGLVQHLVKDILSNRLRCAGSLQTSFDLLSELCKGNPDVLESLALELQHEPSFRRFMTITAKNLVDSNVFIRALYLCVEKVFESSSLNALMEGDKKVIANVLKCSSYLSHTWRDTPCINDSQISKRVDGPLEWFLPFEENFYSRFQFSFKTQPPQSYEFEKEDICLNFDATTLSSETKWSFSSSNRFYKFSRRFSNAVVRKFYLFLSNNRVHLLNDLLSVVKLPTLNHENICVMNTAIVIAMIADRHNELDQLIQELRMLRSETTYQENNDRAGNIHEDNVDVLDNFRQILWFWQEYYIHRGRDRLSLEFSSHIRFSEWKSVVSKLCADDESNVSLCRNPVYVPKSPYRRPPRWRRS